MDGEYLMAKQKIILRSDTLVTEIQYMGSDEMFVRAARRSTKNYDNIEGAEGLINYLMKQRHGSPFEHGGLTVEVEAPIFVAREWMRHRVPWGYSELSGRYSELDPVFWIPAEHRGIVNVGKPARPKMAVDTAKRWTTLICMKTAYKVASNQYFQMLRIGVATEVARSVLPVGTYTNFWATANPRAIMHFLSLRSSDQRAKYPTYPQAEIEDAAQQLETIFASHWPITYNAFNTHGRVAP